LYQFERSAKREALNSGSHSVRRNDVRASRAMGRQLVAGPTEPLVELGGEEVEGVGVFIGGPGPSIPF
jgi:hypothetical protein